MLNKTQPKQLELRLLIKNLLIEKSGYYSYGIGNSKGLSKLNFGEGKTPAV